MSAGFDDLKGSNQGTSYHNGLTLRRLDGDEVLRTVGDEARIRVRGHDAERDRWELELLGAG